MADALRTRVLIRAARRALARLPHARDEILAVLNGAIGDRLAASRSPLAVKTALYARTGPHNLEIARPPVLAEIPAKRKAVLLVHGLMGSEHAWTLGTGDVAGLKSPPGEAVEFGRAIHDELGVTALYLRYNTGRHISTNGRALARRLDGMFKHWPGGLDQLDFVAHSMGGLVTRSALHYGLAAGHEWPHRIGRVVLLGTPSHGAPLEQLAHVAAFTLTSIWNPWTKLIGHAINLRSAGIKDLRHGFCLDADWRHKDVDALQIARPRPTRSPPQVRWFVAAGTQQAPEHWVSRWVGDGMVRTRSATGVGFGTPAPGLLPEAQVRVFSDTNHIALMNDPLVLKQVLAWLTEANSPAALDAAAASPASSPHA